jgi:hypothetical protein
MSNYQCITSRKVKSPTRYSIQSARSTVQLTIGDIHIVIDPNEAALTLINKPDLILVTHIHNDHVSGLIALHSRYPDVPIAMTDASWHLLQFIQSDAYAIQQQVGITLELGNHLHRIRNCGIKALPAGHLLGAAMFHIEHADVTVLVSGDFALRALAGGIRASWPTDEYDYVLLDATHLHDGPVPNVLQKTNNRSILNAALQAERDGSQNTVFSATSLGPAQEVLDTIAVAQRAGQLKNYAIVMDGYADKVTSIYRSFLGSSNTLSRIPYASYSGQYAFGQKSITISSNHNHNELTSLANGQPVIYNGIDAKRVSAARMFTTYAHASARELLCTALALRTERVGFYQCSSSQTTGELFDVLRASGRIFDILYSQSIQGGSYVRS